MRGLVGYHRSGPSGSLGEPDHTQAEPGEACPPDLLATNRVEWYGRRFDRGHMSSSRALSMDGDQPMGPDEAFGGHSLRVKDCGIQVLPSPRGFTAGADI